MRLSAEILQNSEQRPNALGERELVLRGRGIPFIEHLGITRDAYDTFDLSDNRLLKLENFPRLSRLSNLMCSSNYIESIAEINTLSKNLPNITSLTLSYNRISSLHQLVNCGVAFPKLEFLTLVGNPVTRKQYYRLYAIHHIPSLKVLDMQKIKQSERDKANRLIQSAAGAALELDVQLEKKQHNQNNDDDDEMDTTTTTKTFIPGGGGDDDDDVNMITAATTSFTKEQKEQLREMVATATSPQVIEEIEASVQKGIFPTHLLPSNEK